jgi:hypothetical protein
MLLHRNQHLNHLNQHTICWLRYIVLSFEQSRGAQMQTGVPTFKACPRRPALFSLLDTSSACLASVVSTHFRNSRKFSSNASTSDVPLSSSDFEVTPVIFTPRSLPPSGDGFAGCFGRPSSVLPTLCSESAWPEESDAATRGSLVLVCESSDESGLCFFSEAGCEEEERSVSEKGLTHY